MTRENNTFLEFLENGGEAAETIRAADWSGHALGACDKWPVSLCTTLSIILKSEFPVILFWGPDSVCFYNDAFLPLLDRAGKHPQAMGQKGEDVWEESWGPVQLQINRVMEGKAVARDKDYLLAPGGIDISEVNNWSYSSSTIANGRGEITGVLITYQSMKPIPGREGAEEINEEAHHILESITDGFYALNEDWIVTRWNREAEKLLGIKRKEILGKNIWEAFPEGKELKLYPEYAKVMNSRSPTSFEEYYEPWGKWFVFNAYPSKDGIFVYFRDITDQRRLQIINKRTEEISGVAGWELDISSQNIFLTPKAYEIYGLSKDEEIDLGINKQLFDDESLNKIEKALERAIENKKPYEIELNVTTPGGTEKIVRVNGFPQLKDGKVTKLYGTLENVTKEINEQEELKKAYEKLKTAQKIAKLGYWTHDIIENNSEWSEEVYNIWEQDPHIFEPNFENMLETIYPEDREMFLTDASAAFPDQNFYDTEHRIVTPDGKIKWILERITLHRNKNGEPQMLEGIAQDITEQKRQEKEIREALKEKETLLAEVHHRVKNNLAVVSGMMQLQAYEEENEMLREKLLGSVSRVISMASIHEQLYQSNSFSKLDFSANLETLVEKVVDTMQVNINITLDFDLEPVQLNVNQAIPLSLVVNEIITNILKHGFKGREKGKVSFTLSEEGSKVELSIKDNGVGMPEEIDTTENKTLGLRLINILAQQLEASYKFNSEEEGTVFSISFEKVEIKGIGSTNL